MGERVVAPQTSYNQAVTLKASVDPPLPHTSEIMQICAMASIPGDKREALHGKGLTRRSSSPMATLLPARAVSSTSTVTPKAARIYPQPESPDAADQRSGPQQGTHVLGGLRAHLTS